MAKRRKTTVREEKPQEGVPAITASEAEAFRQWYKARGTSRFLIRAKKENTLDVGDAIWVDIGSYGEVLEAVKNAQEAQERTGGGALTSIPES